MNTSMLKFSKVLTPVWVLILLTSCARSCTESALSDVVVEDPGLMMLEMTVEKEMNAGYSSEEVRVWVRDKNEQALSLLQGSVDVNGKELSIKRNLANLPYYLAGEGVVQVSEGEKYDINVTLGDESIYTSSVSFPENNIRNLEIPDSHDPAKPLTISWNKLDPAYQATLSYQKQIQTDTTSTYKMNSVNLSAGQTSRTFPPSFFTDGNNPVESVSFTLTTEIRGTVHDGFRSDSYLKGIFSASKTVDVTSKQVAHVRKP